MNVNDVEDDVAAERANTTVGAASACPPVFARYGYPSLTPVLMLHVPVPVVKSKPVYVDCVFICESDFDAGPPAPPQIVPELLVLLSAIVVASKKKLVHVARDAYL